MRVPQSYRFNRKFLVIRMSPKTRIQSRMLQKITKLYLNNISLLNYLELMELNPVLQITLY